ncbi:unnamed protein product [Schistosoma rodhaini]|uniref:SS18 N-terminal domain-containing protein n=1 Tax=Schistosoma rodhaini TaxID=6188 RepID=A0AA85G7D3_9TREM|nr:unnamed protein product [Schistosoma rodhaini]
MQPGHLRREQPIQPSSIQKMLDENVRLIHSLMAHQRVGAVKEAVELERVLHRNLIYLATIADRTATQHAVGPTSCSHPIPSSLTQPNQIQDSAPNYQLSVVNASSDLSQSSVLGQPHQITVNSSVQHPVPMAVGPTTISTVGNPIMYQQYLVSSASHVPNNLQCNILMDKLHLSNRVVLFHPMQSQWFPHNLHVLKQVEVFVLFNFVDSFRLI